MKPLKIISALLLLYILCISIYSCSNSNPVTPTGADTTIDSARYNWTNYASPYNIYGPGTWIRDSNDMFFNDGYYLHFNNGIFTQFPIKDFYTDFLGGFDRNTGYLIGHSYYLQDSVVRIKKWDGSSFSEIPVGNNKLGQLWTCFFYKPDEIWLADFGNQVKKFNGTDLISYPLNIPSGDSVIIEKIYFDSTVNKLRALTYSLNPNASNTVYIYEFNGSAWNKSFDLHLQGYALPNIVNGYLISFKDYWINYLNNSELTPFADCRPVGNLYYFDGISRQNIFVSGTHDFATYYFYNWNGIKWSREHSPFNAPSFFGNENINSKNADRIGRIKTLRPSLIYSVNERTVVIAADNSIIIGTKK